MLFALVALVTFRPDSGDKLRPKLKAIFVRRLHNESYDFKFGVAGMKELNKTEVHLWKVVKGPELKETDFNVKLKTPSEEEIKEWVKKKKEHKGDVKDDKRRPRPHEKDEDRRPKPHPRPHFKHAIVSKVTVSDASCDDQGPYLVKYGSCKEPKVEADQEYNAHTNYTVPSLSW